MVLWKFVEVIDKVGESLGSLRLKWMASRAYDIRQYGEPLQLTKIEWAITAAEENYKQTEFPS
jgi:hypothetical protein